MSPTFCTQRLLKQHPLDLTIDALHNDGDPWPIELMMVNILNDYLHSNSRLSGDEAARCLAAILRHLIAGAQWLVLATEWLW